MFVYYKNCQAGEEQNWRVEIMLYSGRDIPIILAARGSSPRVFELSSTYGEILMSTSIRKTGKQISLYGNKYTCSKILSNVFLRWDIARLIKFLEVIFQYKISKTDFIAHLNLA